MTDHYSLADLVKWVSPSSIFHRVEVSDGLSFNDNTYLQDNKDLYAEEAAAQRERERQRMLTIPGLIAPSELQDEMVDS